MDTYKLEGLKTDTLKAKRVQKDVTSMEQQCEEKQAQIETLDQRIHDITTEIERLLEVHQQAQIIMNKIAQISQQKQLYRTNLSELENDLTTHHESDEELEALLQAQSNKNAADENARRALEVECNRLEQQLRAIREKVSSKLTQIGRLQAASDVSED